jgi:ketosteroid isomerase-like protein
MRNIDSHCAGLFALFIAVPVANAGDSDVQAIESTYRAWVEAANQKDIEKWSSFLAEDPYFSPADAPPLTNREAVLAYYEKSFSDPEFSLKCEQREVHVSRSGDMAWSRGMCRATFSTPNGGKGCGSSQWIKVWTKHPDGSWKGRINSWKSET